MPQTKVGKDEIADKTKRVQMQIGSAGAAGTVFNYDQGGRVAFSGTPAEFARASVILPMDYVAGTDIALKFLAQADSTQSITYQYYIAAVRNGSTGAVWNVANNVTIAGGSHTANIIKEISISPLAAANFQPGDQVSIAVRPNAALTGSTYINILYIDYTADS